MKKVQEPVNSASLEVLQHNCAGQDIEEGGGRSRMKTEEEGYGGN
jgi:hypothetical protein